MNAPFVRFVVGADDADAAWLTGVFAEARLLDERDGLYRHEADLLEATFAWFNEHLPCPPFQQKLAAGEWTRDAVAWFKPDAAEPIRRAWDIVALLREAGVAVRLVTIARPGRIVYEDRYQVVAETPRRAW